MRISKAVAAEVATKLVEQKRSALKLRDEAFKKSIVATYAGELPEAIKNVWLSNPNYLKKTSSVRILDEGQKLFSVSFYGLAPSVPYVEENHSSYATVQLSKRTDRKSIISEIRYLEKNRERIDALESTICQALIGLKTHKAVAEAFPEDVPADYLIWYRENAKNPNPYLMGYIVDNWRILQNESTKRFPSNNFEPDING